MALEQRIQSLRKRHAELETKIHSEEIRPAPDTILIHQLKSEKLSTKDEMARLIHNLQEAA